jgi:hypothetical protein
MSMWPCPTSGKSANAGRSVHVEMLKSGLRLNVNFAR